MSISLAEKMVYNYQRNEPMPLKGHTKVMLCDPLTGKIIEQVESDNMVTNAVADLLAKNWSGIASMRTLFPLKNLFGGVLLFSNTITENANNYNPPADSGTQSLTANAGQATHATADPYRGNPNGGESVVTDTSWKMVWDWTTNQGNGNISSVCLCPSALGNIGLHPFDNTGTFYSQFGQLLNNNEWFNETISYGYPISIASNGQSGISLWLSGTTFKENTIHHDWCKFGIMRSATDWVCTSTRTATIRGYTENRTFVVQDDNYYYVCKAVSATKLQVDKISKTDMTVTQADITYSSATLYTGNVYSRNGVLPVYPFESPYLYFPNSANTQFYKLNLTDSADIQLLTGTITETIDYGQATAQFDKGAQTCSPLVISSGLIVGADYMINGSKAYPLARPRYITTSTAYTGYRNWAVFVRDGSAVYGNGKQTYSSSSYSGQACVLCPTFLSTINNLENTVTKSTSQTMKVEYTITEV